MKFELTTDIMQHHSLQYSCHDTQFEAQVFYTEKEHQRKSIVLIFHAWSGQNHIVLDKAKEVAEMGYVAVAMDVYGKGVLGKTTDECTKLMAPLIEDRHLLKERIISGYHAVKRGEYGDRAQIGAIGFCFGGMCALDLARAGVDIKAAISFHGLLSSPRDSRGTPILAKVLVLNGNDDPMVSLDDIINFQNEMDERDADWQLHNFGKVVHAFTNPEANDLTVGTVYNQVAEKRSMHIMRVLFSEVFE